MPKTQHIIKFNQIRFFTSLFNRGGYVLDFSTTDFDRFTLNSIGIALCQEYGLSKGKSLEAFCDEGDELKVIKLLSDLLAYYEEWFQEEINPEKHGYSEKYSDLYTKCKKILTELPYNNAHITLSAETIKEKYSSNYLNQQINLMVKMIDENPTEAIGKSKELIETCCKNILENEKIEYDPKSDVNTLIKLTMKTLEIHVDSVSDSNPEAETIKKILGSLSGIAGGISELRNSHGSGHGKDINYQGLTTRHADLAVGSSVALVKYLWDTYEWRNNQKQLP